MLDPNSTALAARVFRPGAAVSFTPGLWWVLQSLLQTDVCPGNADRSEQFIRADRAFLRRGGWTVFRNMHFDFAVGLLVALLKPAQACNANRVSARFNINAMGMTQEATSGVDFTQDTRGGR